MLSCSVILTPLVAGAGRGVAKYTFAYMCVSVCVCVCCLVFLVYWANSITNNSAQAGDEQKNCQKMMPSKDNVSTEVCIPTE